MKLLSIVALACSALSSTPVHAGEHDRVMNVIEAALRLPPDARKLREYARFFALRPDGRIEIVLTNYTRFEGKRPSDYGCSELLSDGRLKEARCPPDKRPKANTRSWVAIDAMPDTADGGCGFIRATYNPTNGLVEELACNGIG